jgi:hypothetical protein
VSGFAHHTLKNPTPLAGASDPPLAGEGLRGGYHSVAAQGVVQAEAEDMEAVVELGRGGGVKKWIKHLLTARIDVEIFSFGRPIAAEQGLNAAAHGPAGRGLRLGGESIVHGDIKIVLEIDESRAAGGVEQRRPIGVAEPPAQRAILIGCPRE